MGQEAGLAPVFLKTLQHGLPTERKLYCFTASIDGDYLGGIAIVRYGDTAEYLAGHNMPDGRSNNAGQLLLWAAIVKQHTGIDGQRAAMHQAERKLVRRRRQLNVEFMRTAFRVNRQC